MASSGEIAVKSSDEVAPKLSGPADYPCVMRLRHRRLLSFLQDQGFRRTYNALIHETDAHFSLGHLQRLVKQGLWGHAVIYLNSYLPQTGRSLHADIFHNFLRLHYGFAKVVAGYRDKFLYNYYASRPAPLGHAGLTLRSITLSILASDPEELRAAIDWERVRTQAASLVHRLAYSTPELRCSLELPATCITPHHVLPLASSRLRQRRHVKKQEPPPRKTKAIIRALERQSYLGILRSSVIDSRERAKDVLSTFLDKTLEAGLRKGFCLSAPIQPSGKEGAPGTQSSQMLLGTFTDPAKSSGISSETNAAVPGAPVCQSMPGTFTDHAKTSGVSSLINAGTNKHLIEAGPYTESTCQDFNRRKNPRDELTTVEEDHNPKRKRTTGEFGEASPSMPTGTLVNLSA